MKLVSLNSWGAIQGNLFFDYIRGLVPTTDIFCLQEIFWSGPGALRMSSSGAVMPLVQELQSMMPGFKTHFVSKKSGFDYNGKVDWPVQHGQVIFTRENLEVIQDLSAEIFDTTGLESYHPIEGRILLQAMVIKSLQGSFNLLHVHGMSRPGSKLDTEERLAQSRKILEVNAALPVLPTILCGDFNLNPDTESIGMLDKQFRNLIKEYSIENTRNEISWKKYNNKQYFADYTFASKDIKVKSFEVPYNLVSDHLPMIVEFSF